MCCVAVFAGLVSQLAMAIDDGIEQAAQAIDIPTDLVLTASEASGVVHCLFPALGATQSLTREWDSQDQAGGYLTRRLQQLRRAAAEVVVLRWRDEGIVDDWVGDSIGESHWSHGGRIDRDRCCP